MKVRRYDENPLISPRDVPPFHKGFEVIGVFNAGVAIFRNETILLLRIAERPKNEDQDIVKAPFFNPKTKKIEIVCLNKNDPHYDSSDPRVIKEASCGRFIYLTSISYCRVARSRDGHHFTVDDQPLLYPSNQLEMFGIEDPRITQINEKYFINFSAVSPWGVGDSLATTVDFMSAHRQGMIFAPENKDVVIFPEKINGKYFALHRPVPRSNGSPEIWIAESDNLLYWGNHKCLIGLRKGMWDDGRIGAGAVPIKTEKGWLEFYHGASQDDRYCMGAVLLDLNHPDQVVARSEQPVLQPEMPYEKDGFFGNVVFSCGAIVEEDTVKMYYGISDTSIACAEFSLNEVLDSLTTCT
ncbi:glycoside hydrolase family 130 protein [Sporolactobacillus sp. THM19-2]|uniref:BtaManbiosPhlase n=1 Tax=Sporolactobacillus sp. THM19-2 TaxID=2511171 RepID=UPI00102127AC|nr:glycoside hydrolase family 130 protein [Sporolactobacillus sp. THM19-2]RYL86663.1 glycosidase [Sporolactobacillus sp. THM19-2]